MTLARINKAWREVKVARAGAVLIERTLQDEVRKFVKNRGPVKETASAMGYSVQHLSDVINGRRKVSAAVIEAIRRLK